MAELTPISALGATAPIEHCRGGLRIVENRDLALAVLAVGRGAARPAPMGLVLPDPGAWIAGQGIAAFWTGPDQWMIEAREGGTRDLAASLAPEAPGCALFDQSDGWVSFEITAEAGTPAVEALMERLVNLDAARFGPGSATRTLMRHMSVFVIRRAEDHLAILGMRSFARSLWHVLDIAAGRLSPPSQ